MVGKDRLTPEVYRRFLEHLLTALTTRSSKDRLKLDVLPPGQPPSFRGCTIIGENWPITIQYDPVWPGQSHATVRAFQRSDSGDVTGGILETILVHEVGHELHCPRSPENAKAIRMAVTPILKHHGMYSPSTTQFVGNLFADIIVNVSWGRRRKDYARGLLLSWYDQGASPFYASGLKRIVRRAIQRVFRGKAFPAYFEVFVRSQMGYFAEAEAGVRLLQPFFKESVPPTPRTESLEGNAGVPGGQPAIGKRSKSKRNPPRISAAAEKIAALVEDEDTVADPANWPELSARICEILIPFLPKSPPEDWRHHPYFIYRNPRDAGEEARSKPAPAPADLEEGDPEESAPGRGAPGDGVPRKGTAGAGTSEDSDSGKGTPREGDAGEETLGRSDSGEGAAGEGAPEHTERGESEGDSEGSEQGQGEERHGNAGPKGSPEGTAEEGSGDGRKEEANKDSGKGEKQPGQAHTGQNGPQEKGKGQTQAETGSHSKTGRVGKGAGGDGVDEWTSEYVLTEVPWMGPNGTEVSTRNLSECVEGFYELHANETRLDFHTEKQVEKQPAQHLSPFAMMEGFEGVEPLTSIMVCIDTSGSMMWGPGRQVARELPWTEDSAYHHALIAVYGIARWLQTEKLEYALNVISFSSKTIPTGWFSSRDVRKTVRDVAGTPQVGGTVLDADVIRCELDAVRGCLVLLVTDGLLCPNAVMAYFSEPEVIARCLPVLIHFNKSVHSPLADAMNAAGLQVCQVADPSMIPGTIAPAVRRLVG